jgi:hypothetical protein
MISLGRPRNGVLRSQVPRLWADSRLGSYGQSAGAATLLRRIGVMWAPLNT